MSYNQTLIQQVQLIRMQRDSQGVPLQRQVPDIIRELCLGQVATKTIIDIILRVYPEYNPPKTGDGTVPPKSEGPGGNIKNT